jgi:hypothetical protein
MALKLVADYIGLSEYLGGNWGHLQIVDPTGTQEIEAQIWLSLSTLPSEYIDFSYRPSQAHATNTDYAPGTPNADPDRNKIVELDIGA